MQAIKQSGGEATFVKTDVSQAADVEALIAKAVATYGRLDCAFNNAGIEGAGALTHKCTAENWNRVIAINLTGVWMCMKAEITQMLLQGGGGAIVNTSSLAGLAGTKGGPAYVASKHGVVGLTKSAALEYGKHNIRVNAVCPGPIRTPMMERIMAMSGNQAAEDRFIKGEPLRRFGQPSEIGEAVVWLCSDHASYVTGLPMPVDGGAIAQ
jgi:NAD(P)-dependent dehydrogenase (short-subunit alcohol dehydrogenase family)